MKILLPTAGVVGTLASVVGVSASNQRSKRAANDQVSHTWKIEVDEISVELNCIGDLNRAGWRRSSEKTKLRWYLKLGEEEGKSLFEKKTVTRNIEEMTVTSEEGERTLWPNSADRDWVGMMVEVHGGMNLRVELVHADDIRQGIGRFLPCDPEGIRIGKEKVLFVDGLVFERNGRLTQQRDRELTTQISLGDQCESLLSQNIIECNLKVTDGSDLDWSTKVSAKARISFK